MAGLTSVRVGDVAKVIGGGTPATKEASNWGGDIPWLTPKDLSVNPSKYTSTGARSLTEAGLRSSSAKLLPKGAVLVSSRAPIGYVTIANNEISTNQGFRSLILDETQCPEFWYYLLSVSTELLESVSTGTTFKEISGSALANLRFEVPSLVEQERIAGVLGSLDNLIDENHAAATKLFETVAATYQLAAAASSTRTSFGDVARLVKDSANPSTVDPSTTYLGLEHFGTDGRGLVDRGTASGLDSSKTLFAAGDVLYGKLRPYFRKVAWVGFSGVCTTEAWVLRPRGTFSPAFVYSIVASQRFTDFAMAGSGGTHMPRANWSHVASMSVTVPPMDVMNELDDGSSTIFSAATELEAEALDLRRQRDELLPLLISGRIQVEEAA